MKTTASPPPEKASKTKKIGVNDIAKAAGISPAAVSSLLRSPNGKGRVSDKTRLAILQACRELGYEPPQSVAFYRVYPEMGDYCFVLSSDAQFGFRNPFYAQLLKGLTDALPNSDGHIHFCRFSADKDYLTAKDQIPAPIRNGVATKIVCAGKPNLSFVEVLRGLGLSVVYLGQEIPTSGVVCVTPDFAGGVRSAIDHLRSLGHTKIAIAGGPYSDGSYNIIRQRKAVEEALKAHNLPLRNEYLFFVGLDMDGGASAFRSLLQLRDRPTALYCFNDMIAVGAVREAEANGLKVPEDLSVVGFDDIVADDSFSPKLTTVHSPVEELARHGMAILDDLVKDPHNVSQHPHLIMLPTQLVIRQTTGPVCSN